MYGGKTRPYQKGTASVNRQSQDMACSEQDIQFYVDTQYKFRGNNNCQGLSHRQISNKKNSADCVQKKNGVKVC